MKTRTVYRHLVDPRKYAGYSKRPVKVVTRQQLGDKIQFCSIRMFAIDKATMRMNNFKNELDAYTVRNRLGDVLWPFCDTLNCENLDELIDEVKARGLFMFDFWGFVPGSWSATEPWGEYAMKPGAVSLLKNRLGERFLGFDNGEQDGRYIGGYAPMMCPATADRAAQFLNFQRHFEKLSDSMQHYITALVSLHYGHYFLKENDVIMLGAECAQALPSVNLWYAFNRGAGRQYGALWFGNASVWNRWGYKNYSQSGNEGYEWGPEYGTSLSLLRRILYIHYTYNCDILGYESGWLYENVVDNANPAGISGQARDGMAGQYGRAQSSELTPIGVLQSDALQFAEKHGYPGPMHTPVAVALDFFTGYAPPRHLYTGAVYQSWGNLAYDEGDYQTHALMNLLYPGYEDAGFFRDERGFLTATPYGDMFDVLLGDAETEVLKSYNRVVLSGSYGLGAEEFDKIRDFTLAGGSVNVFLGVVAGAEHRFEREKDEFLGFFGLRGIGARRAYGEGSALLYNGTSRREKTFELYDIELDSRANVLASTADGRPAIYEIAQGKGRVCVVAVPFGIHSVSAYDRSGIEDDTKTSNGENEAVPPPYDLLETVKAYLGDCFNAEKLVDVDPALCWTVNLMEDGRLRLTVANNMSEPRRFDIRACVGTLARADELDIPNVDTAVTGYYPYVYSRGEAAGEGQYVIEPLDIRMFVLTVEGLALEEKEEIVVPDRTAGRYLRLDGRASLREQIAKSPTVGTHFEGVKVDARYFMEREQSVLEYEAGFVKRRAMRVIVDFSGLMNHYPDISLLDNIAGRYAANMELVARTLDKAAAYGCTKAVIGLHRNAENHVTSDDADACFAGTIGRIAAMCGERGMALYVQNGTPARHRFLMPRLAEWIDRYGLDVRIAWNVGHSLIGGEDIGEIIHQYGPRISALLLSAPVKDIHGQLTDAHAPLRGSAFEETAAGAALALMRMKALDFVALDAVYRDFDEVYRDIKSLL